MTIQKTTQLIQFLEQEINWLNQLIEVLLEEKNVLLTREYESLEQLANQKEALSYKIEQSAQERVALLQIKQHNNQAKAALQAFLENCSEEEARQLSQLNKLLAEKLGTCRELNSVNGQVIATNINVRQQVIGAITGQDKANAINVYTATGNVKATAASREYQEA